LGSGVSGLGFGVWDLRVEGEGLGHGVRVWNFLEGGGREIRGQGYGVRGLGSQGLGFRVQKKRLSRREGIAYRRFSNLTKCPVQRVMASGFGFQT